ncbi:MAG: NAD(P)-binding protein, partial [Prevotella sp.]
MTYDIVIIGSGLGGLQCAELLSQAGRGVMVLERAGLPGGCLCNYSRAGMTFDTGFHYVGGIGEGQSLHEPFRRLGLLGLPWHKLDAGGFDRVMIGSDNYVFAEGFDEFAAALACRFPSERVALGRYAMLLKRTAATTPVVQEAESDRRLTEWMLRT